MIVAESRQINKYLLMKMSNASYEILARNPYFLRNNVFGPFDILAHLELFLCKIIFFSFLAFYFKEEKLNR